MGKVMRMVLPPVGTLVVSGLAAEAMVRWMGVPAYLLPPPSEVFVAAWEEWPMLGRAMVTTCEAALAGFAGSAVLGIVAAVVLSQSRWVQRAFYPYAVFFQTVPIVAIAPLLVLWFGAGFNAVAVSALIVSVFPVIANTLTGLLSTDPALADLFRLYGAGRWATLVKLKLPSALPSVFTGLRVAAGLAVIGAIVGEFVAGFSENSAGLGITVLASYRQLRTDLLFAAVLAASLLGLGLFGAVNLGSWWMLRRWHVSERRE